MLPLWAFALLFSPAFKRKLLYNEGWEGVTFKCKYSVPGTGLRGMWSEGAEQSFLWFFLQLVNINFKNEMSSFCRDCFFPVYASMSLASFSCSTSIHILLNASLWLQRQGLLAAHEPGTDPKYAVTKSVFSFLISKKATGNVYVFIQKHLTLSFASCAIYTEAFFLP